MPSMGFTKQKGSKAVAVVRGGPNNGEVLYINADDKTGPKEIVLPEGSKFSMLPNPDDKARDVFYVAGQSGAGKSYFAKGLIENYKKMYPERGVYLVSKLNEDETLDSSKIAKPGRISLDSILKDPPKLEEFDDTFTIFDDWDTIQAPYEKPIKTLMEDICIMGRHHRASCAILSHNLVKDKKQSLLLNEAHYIVLYPASTSPRALKYVCEAYAGLDQDQIKQLRGLGRWVVISKNYPVWIMGETKAYFPHEKDSP